MLTGNITSCSNLVLILAGEAVKKLIYYLARDFRFVLYHKHSQKQTAYHS